MIKHFKQKLKKNNGFTGQDIIIAIFIIVIFLSTFTTIMVNLANTSGEISKVKRLTETVTKIADKFDALAYEELEETTGEKDIKDLFNDVNLPSNMQATYEITEMQGTKQKRIKLKVRYPDVTPVEINIGKQQIEEIIEPDIDSNIVTINTSSQYPFNRPTRNATESVSGYTYENNLQIVPIKFVWTKVDASSKAGSWVVTTEDDIEWYSLEENIWPTFAYSAAQKANNQVNGYTNSQQYTALKYNPFVNNSSATTNDSWSFIWIPRILRDNNQYVYAYENTNNKISFNNKEYYQDTAKLNLWDSSLHGTTGIYKYQRGTLLGRNSKSQGTDLTTDGWKKIIENLPSDLKTNIQKIDMH